MSYTYLPSSPYSDSPVIAMTANPASKKINNLLSNPNVSLLVHDWVSHRPLTTARRPSGGSATGPEPPNSLASLLQNLNSAALSTISATISGTAKIVDAGSEEESWYLKQHVENNDFGTGNDLESFTLNGGGPNGGGVNGAAGGAKETESMRVIVANIHGVRISDYKGNVRDWKLVSEEEMARGATEAPPVQAA
jgi:hypothetical protein